MTTWKSLAALGLSLGLAACGGGAKDDDGKAAAPAPAAASGVPAPAELAGTWGADCTNPYVKFEGTQVTVFPDKATYAIKKAEVANGQATVTYDGPAGEMSDVYAIEGTTLRLTKTLAGGQEATWTKAPMNKCG